MHGFSPYSTGSPGQPQFTKCRSPELETFSCYWTVGDYQDLKIPGSVQVFYARRWRLHALLTFLHCFVSVNGMEKRSGVIQIRSERMWACLCTYAHVQLGLSNTGAEDISGTSLMQRFKSAKEMKWEELRTNEGHLWRQRKLKVRCPALMLTSLRIRRACTDGVRLKTLGGWHGEGSQWYSETAPVLGGHGRTLNPSLCFEKPPFVFYRTDHCLKLIKLNEGTWSCIFTHSPLDWHQTRTTSI